MEINISKDFSKTPGGRFKNEGDFSGEEFREKFLRKRYLEAKSNNEKIKIILDGCFGYPSSFIDESFGGLARDLNDNKIFSDFVFISDEQPGLIEDIKKCIKGK